MLAVLLAWHRVPPAGTTPLAALGVGVMVVAVIGAGCLLAALNVMYRDFRHTTTFLLQAWMFATPAIYVASFGDTSAGWPAFRADSFTSWFVLANPLNGSLAFCRAALFGWPLPWSLLGVSALTAGLMLAVGLLYFRRSEDSFADIL